MGAISKAIPSTFDWDGLVCSISSLADLRFVFVRREANRLAHCLAKTSLDSGSSAVWTEDLCFEASAVLRFEVSVL